MSEDTKFEFTTPMAVVAAGVIIAGAILYANTQSSANAAPQGGSQPTVEAHVQAPSAADYRYGSANAEVVLIEYSDFQCPYCTMVHTTLKGLVDSSNGKVAWIMRNLPLTQIHPQANPAANAAECIGEQLGSAGWWRYADAVFANPDKLSAQYSAELAKQFGADTAKYNACVSSGKYQAKIDAQTADVRASGGNGTPFTVVYGKGKQVPVSGAVPAAMFQSVIDSL